MARDCFNYEFFLCKLKQIFSKIRSPQGALAELNFPDSYNIQVKSVMYRSKSLEEKLKNKIYTPKCHSGSSLFVVDPILASNFECIFLQATETSFWLISVALLLLHKIGSTNDKKCHTFQDLKMNGIMI